MKCGGININNGELNNRKNGMWETINLNLKFVPYFFLPSLNVTLFRKYRNNLVNSFLRPFADTRHVSHFSTMLFEARVKMY